MCVAEQVWNLLLPRTSPRPQNCKCTHDCVPPHHAVSTMGAGASSEVPVEVLHDAVQEVFSVFSPIFLKAHALLTLEEAKAAAKVPSPFAHEEGAAGLRLAAPPEGRDPLAVGWVTKLGDSTKNWRRRFFVLTNESLNCALLYFEKEDQQQVLSKKKGSISPGFYSIRRLKREDETREFGDHALALTPRDGVGRVWYLRCDSAADAAKWKAALRWAATAAKPPLSLDPINRAAFLDAFRRTRCELNMWGVHHVAFNEERELLGLARTLARENDPAGVSKEEGDARLTPTMLQECERVLREQVEKSWRELAGMLEGQRAGVAAVVRHVPHHLAATQAASLAALISDVADDIQPIVKQIAAFSARPLLAAFLRPVVKAHCQAVELWWKTVADVCAHNALGTPQLKVFFRDTRWKRGVLLPAFSHLRALTRGAANPGEEGAMKGLRGLGMTLVDLLDRMLGVSLLEVEELVEASLATLVQRAVFHFASSLEGHTVRTADALQRTLEAMVADSCLLVQRDLRRLMLRVMLPTIRRQVEGGAAVATNLALSATHGVYPPPLTMEVVARVAKLSDTVTPTASFRRPRSEEDAGPARRQASGSAGAAARASTPKRGGRPARTPHRLVSSPAAAAAAVAAQSAALPLRTLQVFLDTDVFLDAALQSCLDEVLEPAYVRVERAAGRILDLADTLPRQPQGAGGS